MKQKGLSLESDIVSHDIKLIEYQVALVNWVRQK